jgi:hypothetical protein
MREGSGRVGVRVQVRGRVGFRKTGFRVQVRGRKRLQEDRVQEQFLASKDE